LDIDRYAHDRGAACTKSVGTFSRHGNGYDDAVGLGTTIRHSQLAVYRAEPDAPNLSFSLASIDPVTLSGPREWIVTEPPEETQMIPGRSTALTDTLVPGPAGSASGKTVVVSTHGRISMITMYDGVPEIDPK
jgi:hypothetical protein